MWVSVQQSGDMYESVGINWKEELDSVKEIFFDTNIILLTVTMIVSILHSIFEFLAVKNDI